MEHEYFKDRISAYFDGELKHEEEKMIAEHLQSCEECQKLYAELEKLDQLVEQKSGLKDDDYWETQAQKIENLIYPEEKSEVVVVRESQWKGLGWKVSSLVAVAAAVVFIAVNYQDIQREIPAEKAPSSVSIPSPQRSEPAITGKKEETQDTPDEISTVVDSTENQADIKVDAVDNDFQPAAKVELSPEKVTEEPVRDKIAEMPKPKIGIPTPVADESIVAADKKDSILLKEEIKAKPVAEFDELADLSIPEDAEDVDLKIENTRIAPPPLITTDEAKKTAQIAKESFSTGMSVEDGAVIEEPSDSIDQVSLDNWLIRRDSLIEIGSRPERRTSFTKIQGIVPSKAADSEKEEIYFPDNIERELLKCNYNIALLTDDRSEYRKAYEFIEARATHEDYKYKNEARNYLKKLDESK